MHSPGYTPRSEYRHEPHGVAQIVRLEPTRQLSDLDVESWPIVTIVRGIEDNLDRSDCSPLSAHHSTAIAIGNRDQ
jgi:hypothetical protein